MTTRRLAVLDDYANISEKHFGRFQKDEQVPIDYFTDTLNPTSQEDLGKLISRLQPYQIISSMRERTPFPAKLLTQLPNLKLLMTTGMRNLAIDMQAAGAQGIIVTGTKGERPQVREKRDQYDDKQHEESIELPPPAGYTTVIQHSWALLLSLCSRIPQDDRLLKTDCDAWQNGLITSLPAKTLGILGLGKLGIAFAKIGVQAFGMQVIAWSENLTDEKAQAAAEKAGLSKGSFVAVSKEELFRRADVLSLHNVLSERSRGVVGQAELALMKRSAVLLNTSRGPLVDEKALMDALSAGSIKGFATDVFWEEPLSRGSPWRKVDAWAKSAVVMSPHMAYVNEGTMNRYYQEQAEILDQYLRGSDISNKLN